ncbi:uncharacterized protein PV07_03870 [Cladophialophora immunda]|uniref:O-methyltransferase C-terminal domain-containing protein n=2 Tax=Herpotrichiellaceae TaxID=43219 RepID=A0A0D1ZVV7_9EURO|nr:uncharacterized protein PV07_03870 [Cladophialophora immunda]KIW32316.1 hypothetical protein PV07_03870 [Cladophialophora immunda]
MSSQGNDPPALDVAASELVESLNALTNQIYETSKDYKDPSGQQGLLLRQRMTNAARQIINVVREPGETPYEFSTHMAEMGAIRMFMKMKAFDKIPLEGSISYEDLAASLGAEVPLVTRMAWMMVATGFLHQIGEDRVAHSRLSKLYVSGNAQGVFFQIMFDEAMVPWVQWPQFFTKYGLKEPKLGNHNPHSFAWGDPEKNFWEVISKDSKRLVDFNQSMNTLDEVLPVTGMYDFSWIAKNTEGPEDRPLIVDVGGGKGQALKRIMAAFPEIPAKRLVLQDRAPVIEEVIQANEPGFEEVKKIPHDFFQPNPVKGALVYYIRRCMHDWSDENDRIILSHLADAMAPDSRVLITEQVMPNPPTALNAWTDLCMMNLGGKERTEKMFDDLTASAGLKMVGVHKSLATDVAVIECVKV